MRTKTAERTDGAGTRLESLLYVVLLLAALLACGGGSGSSDGHAIDVNAGTLIADYKGNELRGDGKWKDKIVRVTGTVDTVKNGIIGDQQYVTLGSGAALEFPRVQCFLRAGQTNAASALSKGQQVTLQGRVRGLLGNVGVHDCTVQFTGAAPAPKRR